MDRQSTTADSKAYLFLSQRAKTTKKRRSEAQLRFDATGVPDPMDWLVQRWSDMARPGDKRVKPGSYSKRAAQAEEIAFRLLPYLHPRLKAVDLKTDQEAVIVVNIGGDADG